MKKYNTKLSNKKKAEFWKRRYFETQASCEEYIFENYGEFALQDWFDKIGEITSRLLRSEKPPKKKPIEHYLERMLIHFKAYDSEVRINKNNLNQYEIINKACKLLTYRKLAQKTGVKLTLNTPCTYCKKLHDSILKHYVGNVQVLLDCNKVGCRWLIKNMDGYE